MANVPDSDLFNLHAQDKNTAFRLETCIAEAGGTVPPRQAVAGSGDLYYTQYWSRRCNELSRVWATMLGVVD